MSTPFDRLPEVQRMLICDCVMADDAEVASIILSRALEVAEGDPGFRFVCESLIHTNGLGAIDHLQHMCRCISARIAAEAAVSHCEL